MRNNLDESFFGTRQYKAIAKMADKIENHDAEIFSNRVSNLLQELNSHELNNSNSYQV